MFTVRVSDKWAILFTIITTTKTGTHVIGFDVVLMATNDTLPDY